jgi:hypothetical protein
VFLGNMKRLLTTGVSRWNTRQIALWDQVSHWDASRRAGRGSQPISELLRFLLEGSATLVAVLGFGKEPHSLLRCSLTNTNLLPTGGSVHANDRRRN